MYVATCSNGQYWKFFVLVIERKTTPVSPYIAIQWFLHINHENFTLYGIMQLFNKRKIFSTNKLSDTSWDSTNAIITVYMSFQLTVMQYF